MRVWIFCVLLAAVMPALAADRFEFKQQAGDKSRIVSVTDESVYLNGTLLQRSTIHNRMASEIVNVDGGKATVQAVFDVAEETEDAAGGRKLAWGEEYASVFVRDPLGKMNIDKKYFMPSARDMPLFPNRELKPGDSWSSQGEEVLDLRRAFNIKEPYSVAFRANNTYLGIRERKGKKYKAFSVSYNMLKNIDGFENAPRGYMNRNTPPPSQGAPGALRRITGKSVQTLYWDDALGQLAAGEDEFELVFELSGGEKYVFKGKTDSEVIEALRMDRPDVARDVQQAVEELGLPDVTVKVVEGGIAISLEDIQFAADSAVLLDSEKTKLDKLKNVLLKYNDRDILVAGHAAQAGSSENARVKLSQERAASVADYLVKSKIRPPERVITQGYGSSKPVAPNDTEAGRRMNRRVEITILEN